MEPKALPRIVGQKKFAFDYDFMGRRIRKTVATWNGSAYATEYTSTFLYDGWNMILEERDNANEPDQVTSYIHGLDLSSSLRGAGSIGGILATVPSNGTTNYFCYDGVMDPRTRLISTQPVQNRQPACNQGRNPYTDPNYYYGNLYDDNARQFFHEDFHAVRLDAGCDNVWKCIQAQARRNPDGSYRYDFVPYDPNVSPLFRNRFGSLCCKRRQAQ